MDVYDYIVLASVMIFLFFRLFIFPIIVKKYNKHKVKQTYKKYREMRDYKLKIDCLTKQIDHSISLIEKNHKKIDGIFIDSRYCGETEKETKCLKELQEETRSLYNKANTLMNERTLLYEKRNDFASSHNIRYY